MDIGHSLSNFLTGSIAILFLKLSILLYFIGSDARHVVSDVTVDY